jgi:hypothetical protein
MLLLPHRLLDSLKLMGLPGQRRRVFETLRKLVGWRPSVLVLPRCHAHWMTLDVHGVPSRFILSSLRLQLRQFLGDGKVGFAYSLRGDIANIWYWSEADEGDFARLLANKSTKGEFAPWPESLLRQPVEDGVHLLKCVSGFEAVSVVAQNTVRTRWYAKLPAADAWALFIRDAGLNPDEHPLPLPRETRLDAHSPRGWKLSTSLIQPITPAVWAVVATIAIAGLLLVVGGAYSLKLDSATASERVTYEKLARENSATIALQKQISQKVDYLNGFRGTRPPISQLELMKILLESQLLTEESKISVAEWEYRNNRLRLLFSVPQDDFSLGQFLSALEKLPALRDIKLMPDTPPLTVGIQAAIANPVASEALPRPPTDAAVPTLDRR